MSSNNMLAALGEAVVQTKSRLSGREDSLVKASGHLARLVFLALLLAGFYALSGFVLAQAAPYIAICCGLLGIVCVPLCAYGLLLMPLDVESFVEQRLGRAD